MVKNMELEQFESIIEQLNIIKPHHISWGCGNEFGGYSEERRFEGLEHPVIPLIYDHNVFGIAYYGTVYYRTDDLNALNIAKLYARQTYCKLQRM